MSVVTQELQEHQFKELEKFAMFTPAPNQSDSPDSFTRNSRLVWSSYRGNPRLTVFTGVPDDLEKGVIRGPMNPETFNSLMDKLLELTSAPPETRYILDNYTTPKKEDGTADMYSKKRIKISETWIGRNKEGKLWISLRAENRPVLVFTFTMSDFHKWRHGDGSDFTEAENSAAHAKGYIYGVKSAIAVHCALLKPPYDPEAKKSKGSFSAKPKTSSFGDMDDITF